MTVKQHHILVVEDEHDIAELIALHLRDEGYQVTVANDGHAGMRQAFARSWDLVILDLRLPGPDGLSICKALRAEHNYVPILMLTSKSSELDRVLGLELGADDYVTKPFSVSELVARVKSLFRRIDALSSGAESAAPEALTVGDLSIDSARREVRVGESRVELTAREFDLLLHFARHPGRVFSRAQLLDSVWGFGHEGYEHTVNSHINRLRGKIEPDSEHPQYIVTVWGVGYKMQSVASAA
ncbi:response regulator transcription factor [Mangrovimicrobium sediminis]|uniref:Phosphate regulon transcriptional regulatory protein PhoB n=1 Tax=Mangrovimicrobium sediminis TaxID=2562682 RepID=A0A4Z0LYP8_9GAMM|nr:response regulator transcription factor [Haliea sp. SAOS-164]